MKNPGNGQSEAIPIGVGNQGIGVGNQGCEEKRFGRGAAPV